MFCFVFFFSICNSTLRLIWAEEFGRLCVDCYLILFLFETGEFLESDSERDYRSLILSVSGVWVFEYKSGVKIHRLDFLE